MELDPIAAQSHFDAVDPTMARLLREARTADAPIALPVAKPPEHYFASIASAIIGQQISIHAAAAVRERVQQFLGELTPERMQAADFAALKACGLSNQKTTYLKTSAERWSTLPTADFPELTDYEIITHLTALHGVGRWTAEMFLMFSLARPDVFSYGDLGLMQALYEQYEYRPHWNRKIAAAVDGWSPHRTVASLTLWWHKDNGPMVM